MALKLENFNRGKAAMEEAVKSQGKGGFSPFVPQIGWKADEEKFVLFLNNIEEIPTVSMHEWIECGTKKFGDKEFKDYYFGIVRTDPVIGEDHDPLVEKGSNPKTRSLAVAVELEPILKDTGKGRQRPSGFRVKTQEYDRKTDDGTETVVTPVIGVVTQAQGNFFIPLGSLDESEAPIEELPLKIKRIGGDGKTVYQMTPYADQEVDLSGLVENIEGISYLSRDEETWNELVEALDGVEDDAEVAHIVAVALLERRLNELADPDIFHEKTDHIEKVEDRFGGGESKSNNKRPERPARPSQRNGASVEKADSEPTKDVRTDKFNRIKELAAAKKAS